jgi:hypothetical protein
MIVLRRKTYADQTDVDLQENLRQQQVTSRELQIEQMKQQR